MTLNLFVLDATGKAGARILDPAAFARSPHELGPYGPALVRIQSDSVASFMRDCAKQCSHALALVGLRREAA